MMIKERKPRDSSMSEVVKGLVVDWPSLTELRYRKGKPKLPAERARLWLFDCWDENPALVAWPVLVPM